MPELRRHDRDGSGVTLHYEDTGGTGRPVVLIHAWPLSGEMWQPTVPVLRDAGYRVIHYDRRGFGRSSKPLTGYDYDHLADDLAAVLAQLGLADVTLVGFSMGAGEVSRYIARFGMQQLRSIVIAAGVTPYLARCDDNRDGSFTTVQAEQMTADLATDREAFFDEIMSIFFSDGTELLISAQQRQEALAQCRQANTHAILECLQGFGFTDFRDDLANVTVPALVLHGDSDLCVPIEASALRTHRILTTSQLHVISGGTHGINLSHPLEFNRTLLEFLRG